MRNISPIFLLVFIATVGFAILARNPRFAAFHTVDVLELLVCGACLGAALMATLGRLKPRNSGVAGVGAHADRS